MRSRRDVLQVSKDLMPLLEVVEGAVLGNECFESVTAQKAGPRLRAGSPCRLLEKQRNRSRGGC